MTIANGVTNPAVSFGEASGLKVVGRAIPVTAAQLTANAVFDVAVVPAGFTVVHATVASTDIDTGGSPAVVLAVGDAGDDDRFFTGSNVGQAGTVSSALARTGVGYRYPAQSTIQLKVTTAPATAADGTVTVYLLGNLD